MIISESFINDNVVMYSYNLIRNNNSGLLNVVHTQTE